MKTFLPVLLLCIIVSSCAEKNNNTLSSNQRFEVIGQVENLDNGNIVLMNLHEEGKMDTIKIVDGKFSYEGSVTEPTPYLIIAPEILPGQSLFYANKGKVKIKFDAQNPNSLKIEGGKTHKEYESFNDNTKPLLAILDSLQDPMLQTQENFSMDDLKKKYSETIQKLEQQTNSFITKNPKSYLSALLAYESVRAKTNLSASEKEAILKSIDPSIQDSYYAKEIKKLIQQKQAVTLKEKLPVGAEAPNFNLKNTNNKSVSLTDFRGKYVLIDFWASWCGPCRQENPNVVAAYKTLKNKNFEILGVSLDKKKEAWQQAIIADNLPWSHVSDLKGWASPINEQYDIRSIPANYLIDPNGVIIAKNLRGENLAEQLQALIK